MLFLAPRLLAARTWHIDPAGTGDAPTIQAGIDSAGSGDVVLLAPGVYTGLGNRDVTFKGKDVTVTSSDGPESTTIDCQGSGRAFLFVSGEGSFSLLSGVRVINGSHASYGGAVYCVKTAPAIEGNIFAANQAGIRGGAVYCDSSLARVAGNRFEGNQAPYGGAIACVSAHLEIDHNQFQSNSAGISGGAIFCRDSYPGIGSNTFADNTAGNNGGAIYCDRQSSAVVHSNTFWGNIAQGYGGAMALFESSPRVDYNLFRENRSTLGGGVYCDDFVQSDVEFNTFDGNAAEDSSGAAVFCTNYSRPDISGNVFVNSPVGNAVGTKNGSWPTISCCCFFGNARGDGLPPECYDGGGNFAEDPQFCGVDGSGNYYLQSDSPCVPGNGPAGCGLVGAFGVNCATTPAEKRSWGAVKALYGKE